MHGSMAACELGQKEIDYHNELYGALIAVRAAKPPKKRES